MSGKTQPERAGHPREPQAQWQEVGVEEASV